MLEFFEANLMVFLAIELPSQSNAVPTAVVLAFTGTVISRGAMVTEQASGTFLNPLQAESAPKMASSDVATAMRRERAIDRWETRWAGLSFRWIVEKAVRPEERITRTHGKASRNRHTTGTAMVRLA